MYKATPESPSRQIYSIAFNPCHNLDAILTTSAKGDTVVVVARYDRIVPFNYWKVDLLDRTSENAFL